MAASDLFPKELNEELSKINVDALLLKAAVIAERMASDLKDFCDSGLKGGSGMLFTSALLDEWKKTKKETDQYLEAKQV